MRRGAAWSGAARSATRGTVPRVSEPQWAGDSASAVETLSAAEQRFEHVRRTLESAIGIAHLHGKAGRDVGVGAGVGERRVGMQCRAAIVDRG